MFKRGFVKLVAGVLLLVAGMGDVWGQGVLSVPRTKTSPQFRAWQKRQQLKRKNSVQNTNETSRIRLLSMGAGSEEDNAANSSSSEIPNGLIPTPIDLGYLNDLNDTDMNMQGIADPLPSKWDPREKYELTLVRHQDPKPFYYKATNCKGTNYNFGTCWAQSSIGALETWLSANGNGKEQLSVRNLVNRNGYDFDNGTSLQDPGRIRGWFSGGNYLMSAAYLLRWDGPVWEVDDAYLKNDGSVNFSLSSSGVIDGSPSLSPVFHVQQCRIIPRRKDVYDNEKLKRAIMEFGGLYAAMKLWSPYYADAPSILTRYWSSSGAYYCPSGAAGHAVTLVGWDDNYSKSNFNPQCPPPGNGAFIVKDSYGTNAPRDGGYIYVSYYDKAFAFTESCAFPSVEPVDNYAAIYQYDTLGLVNSRFKNSVYAANMFKATTAGDLDAIGFYALVPNLKYQISVYTGCYSSSPLSGVRRLSQKQKSIGEYAGFYTCKLDESVPLKEGEWFSVVINFSSGTEENLLPMEYPIEHCTSKATASYGQGFVSLDGTNWFDLIRVFNVAVNFCCKAYTKSETVSKPTLSDIKISGVKSLASTKSAQLTCTASYSDGTQKTVSPTWSLSAGRNYASISSTGLVTAKSVTETQTATVKAVYTEDGVTKTNTLSFYVATGVPSVSTGLTATQGTVDSCVRVNWTAPNGATEYAVYRSPTASSSNARHLGTVYTTTYNDTTATPGVDYYYFVKAGNASGKCPTYSTYAMGWRKLSAPDEVEATDDLLDRVTVTWSKVDGASYYRVYRSDDPDEESEKTAIGNWQTSTTFNDTTAVAGQTYYYYVKAAVGASGYRAGDCSVIFDDGTRAKPVTLERLDIVGAASIASGASATYTAAAVYSDGTTKSVSPRWGFASGSAFASVSGGKVTAKVVTENATVTLKASCTVNDESATGEKEIKILAKNPGAPAGLSVASATTAGVSLTWTAASGAASYKVYRSESGGTAEAIGTTTETTYVDVSATPGVAYAYSVSAVNGAGESAKTAAVSATVPLAAPTGVSATQTRTDGIRVSWDAVNGATHYRVARSTSASGTKTLLGSWQTQTAGLDLTAVAGTKYWYFVMAATSDVGANASAYSAGVQGLRKVAVTLSSVAVSGADALAAGASALYT